MKKSGFSLVEIIVVTAIMGIVMLIFSPMIDAFIGVQDRLYNQSKVDSRLNEVVDFIKRDVRNARSIGVVGDGKLEGESVRVFDDGKKVIIYTYTKIDSETPKEKHRYVQYLIENNKLKIKVKNNFDSTLTGGTTILSNIETGKFRYQDKILLFHFKIDLPDRLKGKIRNEVRDIGITRINLQ